MGEVVLDAAGPGDSPAVATDGREVLPLAVTTSRDAVPADQAFAERLYLATMRPLLTELRAWDGPAVRHRFREMYLQQEVTILLEGRKRIGWMQVTEQPDRLFLNQIHLIPAARGRGIGTKVLRDLLLRASRNRQSVTLWVVKNNPARTLYERLGFRITAEEDVKLRMEWAAADAESINRSNPGL